MMDAPNFQIPYFGTFLVASGLFGVGLASPYWIFTQDVYKCGLWWKCIGETCHSLVTTSEPGKYFTSFPLCIEPNGVAYWSEPQYR